MGDDIGCIEVPSASHTIRLIETAMSECMAIGLLQLLWLDGQVLVVEWPEYKFYLQSSQPLKIRSETRGKMELVYRLYP